MAKMLIVIIAPPGAGKGTQADLLAEKFGLVHVETGKIIQKKFAEADPADEVIKREKGKQLKGELMTPKVIYDWLMETVKKLALEDRGIVLSGSPRTTFEVENEMPEFARIYGRENLRIFHISLSEEESIKRNSGRKMCRANRHPIPNFPEYKDLKTCPQDGSELIIREDDRPEVIRERYQVYLRDTAPVLDYFKKNGYPIIEINGEQPIEKVFGDIIAKMS